VSNTRTRIALFEAISQHLRAQSIPIPIGVTQEILWSKQVLAAEKAAQRRAKDYIRERLAKLKPDFPRDPTFFNRSVKQLCAMYGIDPAMLRGLVASSREQE